LAKLDVVPLLTMPPTSSIHQSSTAQNQASFIMTNAGEPEVEIINLIVCVLEGARAAALDITGAPTGYVTDAVVERKGV
jgi:hypothetical protein